MNLGVCSRKLPKGASQMDELESSECPAEKAEEHAAKGAKDIKQP
jgi:hypothetical protein